MLHNLIGAMLGVSFLFFGASVEAQLSLPAYDFTAADIQAFVDEFPGDRVGDWPTRTVHVGICRIGVYGAFPPQRSLGRRISSRSGEIRGLLHVGGDCHASDWQHLIGPNERLRPRVRA